MNAAGSVEIKMSFNGLPPELQLLVFSGLTFREIVSASRVCSHWHGLLAVKAIPLKYRHCSNPYCEHEDFKNCAQKEDILTLPDNSLINKSLGVAIFFGQHLAPSTGSGDFGLSALEAILVSDIPLVRKGLVLDGFSQAALDSNDFDDQNTPVSEGDIIDFMWEYNELIPKDYADADDRMAFVKNMIIYGLALEEKDSLAKRLGWWPEIVRSLFVCAEKVSSDYRSLILVRVLNAGLYLDPRFTFETLNALLKAMVDYDNDNISLEPLLEESPFLWLHLIDCCLLEAKEQNELEVPALLCLLIFSQTLPKPEDSPENPLSIRAIDRVWAILDGEGKEELIPQLFSRFLELLTDDSIYIPSYCKMSFETLAGAFRIFLSKETLPENTSIDCLALAKALLSDIEFREEAHLEHFIKNPHRYQALCTSIIKSSDPTARAALLIYLALINAAFLRREALSDETSAICAVQNSIDFLKAQKDSGSGNTATFTPELTAIAKIVEWLEKPLKYEFAQIEYGTAPPSLRSDHSGTEEFKKIEIINALHGLNILPDDQVDAISSLLIGAPWVERRPVGKILASQTPPPAERRAELTDSQMTHITETPNNSQGSDVVVAEASVPEGSQAASGTQGSYPNTLLWDEDSGTGSGDPSSPGRTDAVASGSDDNRNFGNFS